MEEKSVDNFVPVDTMLVEWTEFLWKKLGIDVIFYCEMGGQKWCERSYSRDATEKRNREFKSEPPKSKSQSQIFKISGADFQRLCL